MTEQRREETHEMQRDPGNGRCLLCGKRLGSDEHPVPPEVEAAVARSRELRRATRPARKVTP